MKLSDLSINSIDCAVALSSSISRTRMPGPLPLRAQVGQLPGQHWNTPWELIRTLTDRWVTKHDSRMPAPAGQRCPNRPNILRKPDFFDMLAFIFDFKNREQPILATRPSVLAGETSIPRTVTQ